MNLNLNLNDLLAGIERANNLYERQLGEHLGEVELSRAEWVLGSVKELIAIWHEGACLHGDKNFDKDGLIAMSRRMIRAGVNPLFAIGWLRANAARKACVA